MGNWVTKIKWLSQGHTMSLWQSQSADGTSKRFSVCLFYVNCPNLCGPVSTLYSSGPVPSARPHTVSNMYKHTFEYFVYFLQCCRTKKQRHFILFRRQPKKRPVFWYILLIFSLIVQQYLSCIQKLYQAELKPVDFLNAAEETREQINLWVETFTKGKDKSAIGCYFLIFNKKTMR